MLNELAQKLIDVRRLRKDIETEIETKTANLQAQIKALKAEADARTDTERAALKDVEALDLVATTQFVAEYEAADATRTARLLAGEEVPAIALPRGLSVVWLDGYQIVDMALVPVSAVKLDTKQAKAGLPGVETIRRCSPRVS